MLIRPLTICLLLVLYSPLHAADLGGDSSNYRPVPNKKTNPNRYDPWAQSAANQQLIWRDQQRNQNNKRYHQGLYQSPSAPYIPPQFEQRTPNTPSQTWEDKSPATPPLEPQKNPKLETWRPLHKDTAQPRPGSVFKGTNKGKRQMEILVDGKPAVFRPLPPQSAPE